MDFAAILADVQAVATIGSLVVQIGEDAAPFITTIENIVVNKQPLTDDERAQLMAQEQTLRAQLQVPLPADPSATS